MSRDDVTIPSHLAARLKERAVDCGFGIVGDYALRLFADLEALDFPIRVTADEQGSAFAADAYARLKGLGVVAVTYGVGAFKIANAVAGAWAEQVPLLVISGAPGMRERAGDVLLHHKVRNFDSQLVVFEELTCAQAVLTNPAIAADEIDRVIAEVLSQQRPGYIEIPRDMVEVPIAAPRGSLRAHLPTVDDDRLQAAVADAMECLRDSPSPVVHAGAMVWRRGLAHALKSTVEPLNVSVTTSSLAKGLFPERHPLSLGVYMGAVSPPEVVERVENASMIVSFGVLNTDLTMGAFTAHLDPHRRIDAQDTEVTIGLRTYKDVPLWSFLPALAKAALEAGFDGASHARPEHPTFTADPDAPLSVARVIAAVDAHLDDRHGLLVDPGECLFASVDLSAPNWCLASAYYATMGYAVPAALGAGLAEPQLRPVVLVGDGAFAMTGLEAAASPFHGVNPVILVLDNNGYGTQRPMMDGDFNDIPPLKAERLPDVFGTGRGWLATTEGELDSALVEAMAADELCIIRALVPQGDRSPALLRLTDSLKKRV
jgi:TPP-dependent 2-oxoacid decarboxylase